MVPKQTVKPEWVFIWPPRVPREGGPLFERTPRARAIAHPRSRHCELLVPVGSVQDQLHLVRDVVRSALRADRRLAVDDSLVLEAEVQEVKRSHVVLQAARDPRLVAGRFERGGIIVADLPHLELAKDGELQAAAEVRPLCEV